MTREALLENVWDFAFDGNQCGRCLYPLSERKIDEVYNIKLIHTVRGVGYVIKDE